MTAKLEGTLLQFPGTSSPTGLTYIKLGKYLWFEESGIRAYLTLVRS